MGYAVNLNKLFSFFNNAVAVRKKYVIIRNTSLYYNFLKLLYVKHYILGFNYVSFSNCFIVFFRYNLFMESFFQFIPLFKGSQYIFVTVLFLKYFIQHCQIFNYCMLISTNLGVYFVEDAVKLNVGGFLLCYLRLDR